MLVGSIIAMTLLVPARPVRAAELLLDGFESGTLAQWSSTTNFVAQQGIVFAGSWAGRATATNDAANASATLATPQSDVYLRSFVQLVSHTGSTPLLRMRTATGAVLASLNVNASDELVFKNVVTGATSSGGVTMPTGVFVELQLHVFVSGAAGVAEVWIDGVPNAAMSGSENFGTTPVGRVVLGRNDVPSSASMDVVFDDVVASTTFVGGDPGGDPPATPTGLATTSVTASAVGLTWSPVGGATGYTVYRDGSQIGTPGSTTFVDGTVQPETTYDYTVDAFNGNGNSAPSAPLQVTTPPGSSGDGIVVRAAGDIACDPADTYFNNNNGTSTKCRHKWTGQLLAGADRVFALGDTQYECAGLSAYNQSYDPTWGQHKAITHPILSDEDYDTSGTGCGAAGPDGYFAYWGAAAGPQPGGYYSFDLGGWHVVALNTECSKPGVGGCDENSPQNDWLEQDLNASPAECTIALMHTPRFASKKNNAQVNAEMLPLWEDLYAAGVEIVLSGDSHFYERFAPQNPQGAADANGVVQWVVGVGGKNRGGLASTRRVNSMKATAKTFGVLELTLHQGSYDWDFLVEGSLAFTDTGSATCH
jgi:hypothetical protein